MFIHRYIVLCWFVTTVFVPAVLGSTPAMLTSINAHGETETGTVSSGEVLPSFTEGTNTNYSQEPAGTSVESQTPNTSLQTFNSQKPTSPAIIPTTFDQKTKETFLTPDTSAPEENNPVTVETDITHTDIASSKSPENDFTTPVATSNHVTMEKYLNSTHMVYSTSPENHPTISIATSQDFPMETDITPTHIASPTSPENDFVTPLATSNHVTMETDLNSTHMVYSTSPENHPTISIATSQDFPMETDITPTHIASPTSPENDFVTPLATSNHVTMETDLNSTHMVYSTSPENHPTISIATSQDFPMETDITPTHIASPTSPENDLMTPLATSNHVTMETDLNSTHMVYSTSPENHPTNSIATSQDFPMETDITPTHIASLTSPENDLITPLATSNHVTMETDLDSTHMVYSTSPENHPTISIATSQDFPMETDITPTHIASPTSPENDLITPLATSNHVTMETDLNSTHMVYSTSPENHPTISIATSQDFPMETDITPTHIASPTSPENDLITPDATSNHVTMETDLTPTHISYPKSSENYATTPMANSSDLVMETDITPTHIASPTYPENNSATPEATYNLAPSGMDSTPTHMASSIYPENYSRTRATTSNSITMNTDFTSTHVASRTSQESYLTVTGATSSHINTETSVSLTHNPIVPPTSPENDLTMSSIPSDNGQSTLISTQVSVITEMDTNTKTPMFPEKTPTTPTRMQANVTMETWTPSQRQTVSMEGSPTTFTSTAHYVSTYTDTTPLQHQTTMLPAPESSTTLTTGSPSGASTEVNLSQTTMPVTPGNTIGTMPPPSTPTSKSQIPYQVPNSSTVIPEDYSSRSPAATSPTEGDNHTTSTSGNATSADTLHTSPTTGPFVPSMVQPNDTHPTETFGNSTFGPSTTYPPVRPEGFCLSNPCPFDAQCLEHFMNFSCQCQPGFFYSKGNCIQGRVFPGTLHLGGLSFQSEMKNQSSQIFQETSQNISKALHVALVDLPGYVRSTVLTLRQGSVVADVNNLFELSSNATQQSTSGRILTAIQACNKDCGLLKTAQYNATNLCNQDPGPCDTMTTDCTFGTDGILTCGCKEGFIRSRFTNRSCAACRSGERAESGKCVACPFGYAGFNCDDSSLLALVVISCVLGGLLLILGFALMHFCWRRSRKNVSYGSPYATEDVPSIWPNQQFSHIPRANTHWNPAPIELAENSGPCAELDSKSHCNGGTGSYDISAEDLRTFKGVNTSRYSYLIQGHENPYFLAEDGRRSK